MYSDYCRVTMFRQPNRMMSPHPSGMTLDQFLSYRTDGPNLSGFAFENWAPWVFPTTYPCRHNPEAPVLSGFDLVLLGGLPTFIATQEAAITHFMTYLTRTDAWVSAPEGLKTRRHITRMLDHVRETRGLAVTKIVFDSLLQTLAQKAAYKYLEAPDMSYAHWFAAAEGVELTRVMVRAQKKASSEGLRLDWSRK